MKKALKQLLNALDKIVEDGQPRRLILRCDPCWYG